MSTPIWGSLSSEIQTNIKFIKRRYTELVWSADEMYNSGQMRV